MSNDNKVLPFTGVTPKVTPANPEPIVDSAIVKLLEAYVAKAKRGEIVFAGIAWVDARGIAHSEWEPSGTLSPQTISAALGACAFLNVRFGRACDEGGVDGNAPTLA